MRLTIAEYRLGNCQGGIFCPAPFWHTPDPAHPIEVTVVDMDTHPSDTVGFTLEDATRYIRVTVDLEGKVLTDGAATGPPGGG